MEAPNITMLNGQSGSLQFTETFNYVSGYTAVVGIGAAVQSPEIDQVDAGFTITFNPFISTDKKHVFLPFMTIQQTAVVSIESFITREVVVEATDTAPAIIQELPIQLPRTKENMISTSVLIPDGGTLLLGGQKTTGDVEKEIGVPALSKIPILGRLFTNRNRTTDEGVLLILISPRIIFPDEEEEKMFGSFEGTTLDIEVGGR